MNKQVGIIIAAVVVLVGLGGVWYFYSRDNSSSSNENVTTDQSDNEADRQSEEELANTSESIDSAVAKLKEAGLTVGPDMGIAYDMVHADSGVKVEVDGVLVEIYGYNTLASKSDGIDALNELRSYASDVQVDNAEVQPGQSEVFDHQNLVYVVHSSDQAFVDRVKQAVQ